MAKKINVNPFMNINIDKNKNYIILFLLFLLIMVCVYHFFNQSKIEKFQNKIIETFDLSLLSSVTVDYGSSDNTSTTGSISFNKKFKNPPLLFAQIIGNEQNGDTNSTDVYSVQIVNVTNTSFTYIKNRVFSKTSDSKVMNLQTPNITNTTLPFNWIAISSPQ